MCTECNICFEKKKTYRLPCSKKHTICDDCYRKLREDKCPYCRKPFKNIYKKFGTTEGDTDPEPWLDLDMSWMIVSRVDRRGVENISVYRRDSNYKLDKHSFEVRRRRKNKRKKKK